MDLLILFIAVIANILLGLLVYLRNPKSATNILFLLLTIDVALWSVGNYLGTHILLPNLNLFWIRITMALAVPQAVLFFLLIHTFPSSKIKLDKQNLILLLFFTLLTSLVALSPYLFTSVVLENGSPQPTPGIGMLLFIPVAVGSVVGGLLLLIKKYRKAYGLEKVQLRYVLFGVLMMFISIILFNFVLLIFFKITIFLVLGPFYTLLFVGSVGYAIVKHRLLDIRLVVARTVSYTLLIIVFGIFYALFFGVFSSVFLTTVIETSAIAVSTLLALIMAFTFQPIRRLLEKITDSLFYKEKYDSNSVLGQLSRVMASTLRLDDLTHEMLAILLKELRVGKAAFILLDNNKVSAVKHEGFKSAPTLDEEHIKIVAASHHSIVFDETEEGEIKKILRELEISLVVHLRTEGEQIGLLILGDKQSGDIYSEQDVNLLEILAPEAAVAVQNAKAYEEIRRFNITLQEEVDKATTELTDANEKLKELDKLKDEFVSLASHELRTPMTAIKGSLSTILEGYAGTISPESREFLTAAYNENDRLIRLVNNLLNISRIEAGRFTFNLTKLNINMLIDEVIKNLGMAAQEKNLYLKYEGEKNLPLVYADEDKVKEVLINLIGNALKFTHKGGITVKTETKNEMLQIGVCDTGSGIAKEDQELLFKKFSQVKGSYSRQAGGTGLGLYISKQIIEGQKGKVWLESVLGQGSTFFFTLPITT